MIVSRALLLSLLSMALTVVLVGLQGAQTLGSTAPLSVEEVVKLSHTVLSEEVIVTKIKKNGKAFDLSTEELLELKKSGVSDNIIKFLLDPSQPYSPPPLPPPLPAPGPDPSSAFPPKPGAAAKQYPEDVYASTIPPEPGLYRFLKDAPTKIDLKMLLGVKQGAGLGKVLLKKAKTVGYLVGPTAKTRVPDIAPIFYLRLLEGKAIEEVVLVTMEGKGDRREIEMGSGQKEQLKTTAMRQFEALEVGPRLYRIGASKLGKGEYLFFLVGSAEPPKDNYGKGYDFGIDAPSR
jgi:hypothetical protein